VIEHPQPVERAAFTKDGSRFATSCADGNVRVWDSATGRQVGETLRHEGARAGSLAFSPDGKTLAVATTSTSGDDKPAAAYLWDLEKGQRLGAPLEHQYKVTAVAFAPDGKKVLTCGWDTVAQVWDAATGLPIGAPMKHDEGLLAAVFTPDGRVAITGGIDGVAHFWDVSASVETVGIPSGRLPITIQCLAVSTDGRRLAVGFTRDGGEARVYRIARGLSRPVTRGKRGVARASWWWERTSTWWERHFVGYGPDAGVVLTGGNDRHARLTDPSTGQPALLAGDGGGLFRNRWGLVNVNAFSPDGRTFATSSRDASAVGEARLWDARTGKLIGAPLTHVNYVSAMAYSPDGKTLATGGYDCCVHFWNTETAKRSGLPLLADDIVLTVAYSPDGKTLAVGQSQDYSGSYVTVIWDLTERKPVGQVPGVGYLLQFTADGKRLLIAGTSDLKLWDIEKRDFVWGPVTEAASITAVVQRRDGALCVVTSIDGTLRLRDMATGKTVGVPMTAVTWAHAADFSPDREGRLILAGYADGTARLWDSATQKPAGPPILQGQGIRGVRFRPDGKSFVTTCWDGTSRLWPVVAAGDEAIERLSLRLQVLTGLEMGEGQTVRILDSSEWKRRRQALEDEDQSTAPGNDSAASDRDFEDARARDAEQDGDTFAARWHLHRLIACQEQGKPAATDWLAYARRARLSSADGRFEDAAADYDRAMERSSQQQVAGWYRQRILDSIVAKKLPAAKWYLDRALVLAPRDGRLYADRASVLRLLGKTEEREADLLRAAQFGASPEFLAQLGDEYAGRGQWEKAADAYGKAVAREDCVPVISYRQALLCVKLGDREGYRKACARILAECGPNPLPDQGFLAARVFALGPDGTADYTLPLRFAEDAVKSSQPAARADVVSALASVLYRAGRYRDATDRFEEAIKARGGQASPPECLFLAMAHHHLGEAPKAHDCFEKGGAPPTKQPVWWSGLEHALLYREAQVLLQGKKE
jgi:WD40 repeat protein/tetratricopeptide (TPR) repeat protein